MAILFDLDGVLIDSMELHRRVWTTWAAEHDLDPYTVFEATFGRRPIDTIRGAAAHLSPDTELRRLDTLLDAEAHAVRLQAGAARAVDIARSGLWGIVTSTSRERAQIYLEDLGLAVPDVLVGGEDVVAGKPAPDGYLTAAERLGVAPEACLVAEDAPAGIAAARAAGAFVLAVATTRTRAQLADADVVVDDLMAAHDILRDWTER